jgi:uncharacterized repeat protein (TIGR01451 family)
MSSPLQVYAADEFGNLNKNDFASMNVPDPGYGFGDEYNSYPWGMEIFMEDPYVGTGRVAMIPKGVIEILALGGTPPDFDLFPDVPYVTEFMWPPGFIFDDTNFFDWRDKTAAEIWRFHDGAWEQVWQAPLVDSTLSIWTTNPNFPTPPTGGYDVPAMASIRWMQTYTDENGVTALYAAAGSTIEFLDPSRYVEDPWVLIRSFDGENWEKVPTDPDMGGESRGMTVHNGKLYFGKNGVWCTEGHPDEASDWKKVFDPSGGFMNEAGALASFNGYLWVGWSEDTYDTYGEEGGPEIWRSNVADPSSPPDMGEWELIVDEGGTDEYNMWFGTMKVYKNRLYVGTVTLPLGLLFDADLASASALEGASGIHQEELTHLIEILEHIPFRGFTLIRIDDQDGWQTVIGPYVPLDPPEGSRTQDQRYPISLWPSGFANLFNFYCWSLEVKEDYLYLGSFDASAFIWALLNHELSESEVGEVVVGFQDQKAALTPEDKTNIQLAIDDALAAGDLTQEQAEVLYDLHIDSTVITLDIIERFLDLFAGADLWKTSNGVKWKPVTLNGFDNPRNYGFRNIKYAPGTLYVGASNPFQGCEIFKATQPTTLEDPKTATLYIDADHNSLPSPGDTIKYTAEITNVGEVTRKDATFSDTVDPQTTLICDEPNKPTTTHGIVTSCDPTLGSLTVDIGDIDPGVTVTITFYVIINEGASEEVANQGVTSGSNFPDSPTDDPDTKEVNDPTRTMLGSPVGGVIAPINKLAILTPYLALAGLLAILSTVYIIRRRKD